MRRWKFAGVAGLFAVVAAAGDVSAEWQFKWPDSIAALGTSITRAVVADGTPRGTTNGQPEHSYATGSKAGDGVNSHYERIRSANPYIDGKNWNLAASSTEVDDLLWQADEAVWRGAEYVVIEMGANDVCANSTSGMTPTHIFRWYYDWALHKLRWGLPDATVLVTEIPRLRRVYDVGDTLCQWKWYLFRNCDNVLRKGETERNQADARNIEYNNVLRDLTANKYYFGFADDVFEWQFSKGNLSRLDCFHPEKSGQRDFADLTYNPGWFWKWK